VRGYRFAAASNAIRKRELASRPGCDCAAVSDGGGRARQSVATDTKVAYLHCVDERNIHLMLH
jgi:hypothetical protein